MTWLENVQDWGISRNRYWGTPLNIWVCDDCGEMLSIGSKAGIKGTCLITVQMISSFTDHILMRLLVLVLNVRAR